MPQTHRRRENTSLVVLGCLSARKTTPFGECQALQKGATSVSQTSLNLGAPTASLYGEFRYKV